MLVYLFRAYFADGATFDQTPDDTARIEAHGRAGVGSSYTDLLYLVAQGQQVIAFALLNSDGVAVAAVHLDTGTFELGGNAFYAGDDAIDGEIARELVYFRLMQQIRSQTVDPITGEAVSDWQETTVTRYFLGWRATVAGREVCHVIGIE